MKKIVWLAIPIALSLLSCSKDEPGKYYVVALFGDYHDRWPCQQKYTGKYLTVAAADTLSRILTVDFPNDPTYKGYFDWQGEIREPADSLRFEF